MMKHTSPVLRFGLVAAVVALFPLTEAVADDYPLLLDSVPTTAGAPPARSCSPLTGVTVIAGPNALDNNLNPTAPFPVIVTTAADSFCRVADPSSTTTPPATIPGTCLRWDYRFIYPTSAIATKSWVTLDGDLVLNNATGSGVAPKVFRPPYGDRTYDVAEGVTEARAVRIDSPSGTVINASLYTGTNAAIGKVTVGAQNGYGGRGLCGIQGAQSPVNGDLLLSKQQTFTTTTLGCTVDWTLTPDGCAASAAIRAGSPAGCGIQNRDLIVNGKTASTASCGTEVGGPFGSTESCKWSSVLRQTICVTVP